MAAVIALAWLCLWVWGRSPHGRFLAHDELGAVAGGDGALLLAFVAGWTLMSAAMMLPSSLPLLALFRRLVHRRQDRTRLVALVVVGYLGVWSSFGAVVHLGDWALHRVASQAAWPSANAWALGAGTLLLAGAYQFTPLKEQCLASCRSPLVFVVEHWRGRHEPLQALWLGVHHGAFCLGCCWTLMLLMFVVGVGNVGWMLVLGAAMAAEKTMPWGRRVSRPLGAVLIGWALLVALRAAG
jgi:predicted metal-binding membrane protein